MKVLTVRQPHASLIAQGFKWLEGRNWTMTEGELILIHSSAHGDKRDGLPRGQILTMVRVISCIPSDDEWWDTKSGRWHKERQQFYCNFKLKYQWMLAENQQLDEPVPCRGKLGLWTLPHELTKSITIGGVVPAALTL